MYSLKIVPPNSTEEIDVTHRVIRGGLGTVKQKIESSDFVVGRFSYDSMKIKLFNEDGEFSIGGRFFPVGGGYTQVNLSFTDGDGNSYRSFSGIAEEMGIAEEEEKKTVQILVVSLDSIINKTLVPAGLIANGTTLRNALFQILNRPPINKLLNISLDNIDLGISDLVIENGEWFSLKSGKQALDPILLASSTFAYVDRFGNYVIRPRVITAPRPRKVFYLAGDKRQLGPVLLSLKKINSGINRVFNKVEVNGQEYVDPPSVDFYGLRPRGAASVPFIRDENVSAAIARELVNDFRHARDEMQATVLSKDVQDIEMGTLVRLDIRPIIKNPVYEKLPDLYGQGKYGKAKYPYEVGKFISREIVWMVYDKIERPEQFTAILKLRRYGKTFGDEVIIEDIYGSGIYDVSRYSQQGLTYGEAVYDEDTYSL